MLDGLLAAVRAGAGRVLVVRGEPGVGKTALLEYLVGRAEGCRVARGAGVQSEMELPFAGLHQLCAPMLDRLERLPVPQRDALRTAFGLSEGAAPDRFLVGLAVLSLFAEMAEERPLVCVVDDAQWLDRASAQAQAFVARRLAAESVALVFAVGGAGEGQEFMGLPDLVVEGLGDDDARALLDSVVAGRLDERVRDRIVAETRGNPLALLELPRGLAPTEMAGGFGLPDAAALPDQIEDSFGRRLAPLAADTRLLLLVAAAEPLGEPMLVWRAAERLGIAVDAAAPAEGAGLVEFGARVRFRHPLVRSAVYRAATPQERQRVHRALAEATDPELDPDRRAWHRAHATAGPDEDVAAELERSADRAQARGGLAAAAAFLEQATGLTPDPAHRVRRALAAAEAKLHAGSPDTARELLVTAEAGPLDELQRARVDLLRAKIAFAVNRGSSEAPPLLLKAARQLEPLDLGLARETYLHAFSAAMFVGRLGGGRATVEAAEAARAAPPPLQPGRACDLLLDGLATRFTEGYAAGAPILKQALNALRHESELRWLWLACRVAMDLWDDETWHLLSIRQVHHFRDAGALTALPLALSLRAGLHVFLGELAAADAAAEEARGVSAAIAQPEVPYPDLCIAAWRGREKQGSEVIEASLRDAANRGEGRTIGAAAYATAVLNNGLGRYDVALAAAQRAWEYHDLGFTSWTAPELVEAAARRGEPELAAAGLERLVEMTRASGTEWARGIEARSRALLGEGRVAEDLYREAIDRLGNSRVASELARAHLVYGEWLRHENRRLDARVELRTAHDMFGAMGIEAFGDRAARGLLATGEAVRKRTDETLNELTAQEALIARLARDGLTNPEIAGQLFISPRTVEYHLRKVFTKLDITSRRQLDRVLAGDATPAQAV